MGVFAEKQALGAVWDSKQTKGEERALVPIKTKLVVAVLEADFAEISLMRNVNVVWRRYDSVFCWNWNHGHDENTILEWIPAPKP